MTFIEELQKLHFNNKDILKQLEKCPELSYEAFTRTLEESENDLIYNEVYENKRYQLDCFIESEENIYDTIDDESHFEDLYSAPMYCLESTTISESLDSLFSMCENVSPTVSINSGSFEQSMEDEVEQQKKKKSLKKRLWNLVRKHLTKHLKK